MDDSLDELVRAAFAASRARGGGPSSLFDSLNVIEPESVRVRLPLPSPQDDPRPVDPRSSELPPEADERGRYEIAGELARGGIGVVLRARDTELGRDVAMKLLRTDRAHDARALRRFLVEAQVGGQLEHPGVVPVHDVGVSGDGRPFFTMKLVEGRTLRDVFQLAHRGEGGWTITRALGVLQRVCDALAYAHERGVVHRDLKPANVLVGEHGEVHVTDWGLARVVGLAGEGADDSRAAGQEDAFATREGEVLGTPAYMPPEQATGRRDLGPEADVYAVGAMLYHLLVGHAPYASPGSQSSGRELLQAVSSGPPMPVHRIARDAPTELIAICERAMAREPDERYSGLRALGDDLRAFLEGRVVQAHATGAWPELRKWMARNRGLTTSLGAGLALLAGLLAVSLYFLDVVNREHRNVLRLSAFQDLEELRAEADRLWPIGPERARDYRRWLDRGRKLTADLPEHRATLAALEDSGSEDAEHRWWTAQLTHLIAELEAFLDPATGLIEGVSSEHGWGVERRLEWAEVLEQRTVSGAEVARRWAEAVAAVATSPAYDGLLLEPQLGLVPIGADPGSGLWEFAHVLSGEVPSRDGGGRLAYGEEHGIVLVLIPGGRFKIGAQNEDPDDPYYDTSVEPFTPIREVELDPFLVSKFEVTQAQWLRLSGRNPSNCQVSSFAFSVGPPGQRISPLHPVEQVDSWEALDVLQRFELDLPTAAQAEVARRGGTSTRWYTGQDRESLAGHANLADSLLKRKWNKWGPHELWLDDGYLIHAPVGSFAPNPYGLHDVVGNVEEWCKDFSSADPSTPLLPGTGLSAVYSEEPEAGREFGGGSYMTSASPGRSAAINSWNGRLVSKSLGLRAARQLR